MPSTRKQKAKEKHWRLSDIMSDNENVDVIRQETDSEIEVDLESRRLHRKTTQIGENTRFLSNTNVSENSEDTAETSRAINSGISSQNSRKLDE